jgi:hypothetical protein
MIEEIEILHHRESGILGCHSCKETVRLLCIVAYYHEMVVQLGEDSLYSSSEAFVRPEWLSPVFLVQSIGHFKCYICSLEKVLLYRSTEISLISKNRTVIIFPFHVFQIIQVMNVGSSHVIGMCYTGNYTAAALSNWEYLPGTLCSTD